MRSPDPERGDARVRGRARRRWPAPPPGPTAAPRSARPSPRSPPAAARPGHPANPCQLRQDLLLHLKLRRRRHPHGERLLECDDSLKQQSHVLPRRSSRLRGPAARSAVPDIPPAVLDVLVAEAREELAGQVALVERPQLVRAAVRDLYAPALVQPAAPVEERAVCAAVRRGRGRSPGTALPVIPSTPGRRCPAPGQRSSGRSPARPSSHHRSRRQARGRWTRRSSLRSCRPGPRWRAPPGAPRR